MNGAQERFDSQIQLLWRHLRTVKEKLGPDYLSQIKVSTRKSVLGKQSELIEQVEHNTSAIDWINLEVWMQNAHAFLQRQQQRDLGSLTLWGYNAQNFNWFDIITRDPVELLEASPAGQSLRRSFGPNWSAGYTALCRFIPVPSPANIVGEDMFLRLLSIRTECIIHHWNEIQSNSRERASFRRKWLQLTRTARIEWLKDRRCVPREPHSHIYSWARGSKATDGFHGRGLFLSSLLNIEDLSHGDVLPNFLDARASTHPQMFRRTDSPSVALGVYLGYLPLKCVPGMVVFFDPKTEDASEYPASLRRSVVADYASCPSNPCEDLPGVALLQLEAQQRIYEFLLGCLAGARNGLPSEEVERSTHEPDDAGQPSLLTRALRLDYHGCPGSFNLQYLFNLVNASLDEACEDLWHLRQDPEAWISRLGETPGTKPGRTWNLLAAVFGRIDAFHTLKISLSASEQHQVFANQNLALDISAISEDSEGLRLLMSLHVAFAAVLEQQLCQTKHMLWPRDTNRRSILVQLLNLLRANDHTLRVLGLPEAMRVIEREMENSNVKGTVTFPMMQVLNDVSVLAACLEESAKHYNLVSFFGKYISLANELEDEWNRKHRPWRSILENTLAALGKTKGHKLDMHISNQNIDVQSRFVKFWTVIDQHMATSSVGNRANEELMCEIQEAAPIRMIQSTRASATADWVGHTTVEHGVTWTMLKRSRHHPAHETEPAMLTLLKTRQVQTLPVITPCKDRPFWAALSAPSSENSSELSWSDFEKAMLGIGYEIHRHGGSGRRFEYKSGSMDACVSQGTPGTIVFHEPHRKRGKVPHRLAQSLWLRRLQRRFVLEL